MIKLKLGRTSGYTSHKNTSCGVETHVSSQVTSIANYNLTLRELIGLNLKHLSQSCTLLDPL